MNAVAPEPPLVIVCPNCRAENSRQANTCTRCTEDLPPSTPVAAIISVTDSGELPTTIPVSHLRLASSETRDSSRNAAKKQPAPASNAKLLVIRGKQLNAVFPLYEGANLIGRRDDRPVDVDVSQLEPPDRIWSSRRHAVVTVTNGLMTIEDLNSLNGTFVNRRRVLPEHPQALSVHDVVQIGTIQFKVTV